MTPLRLLFWCVLGLLAVPLMALALAPLAALLRLPEWLAWLAAAVLYAWCAHRWRRWPQRCPVWRK